MSIGGRGGGRSDMTDTPPQETRKCSTGNNFCVLSRVLRCFHPFGKFFLCRRPPGGGFGRSDTCQFFLLLKRFLSSSLDSAKSPTSHYQPHQRVQATTSHYHLLRATTSFYQLLPDTSSHHRIGCSLWSPFHKTWHGQKQFPNPAFL